MMFRILSDSSPESDGINTGIRAEDELIDLNGRIVSHALEVLALNFSNVTVML